MQGQTTTIEKKGKSVEEAVQAAIIELGCNIEDVSIEVVEEASKRMLGFMGSKPAVVKVSLLEKQICTEKTINSDKEVRQVVEDLLQKMKIDFQIEKIEVTNGITRINIIGQDMGLLIGRKGETLNALQFIAGLMVNRHREEKIRIVLDVEDYRKKREQSLESLAIRLSEKVKQTQKNVIMRPMSSRERRLVHSILQEDPEVTTYSMGEEPNRKVVIALKK